MTRPPERAGPVGPVSAIVLAGGRSARFGRDKLTIDVGGTPLLARAIEAVAAVSPDIVISGPRSVPWPVAPASTVRSVLDREPFGGPLQALAGAFDVVRSDVAIVVAGDMPSIVPGVLEALIEELRLDATRDAMVLGDAVDPARRQPLPMAVRVRAARAAAEATLGAGDRSLMGLLDRLDAARLPFDRWGTLDPDGQTLLDVDTPADLDRVHNVPHDPRRR